MVLPRRLTALLDQGRWRHPGDEVLAAVIPWFKSPLDFLTGTERMEFESRSMDMFAADDRCSSLFREARGSAQPHPVALPWLDVELAVLIAVNREPGDDVALALDYRTDPAEPRVVGSDFWTESSVCSWRLAAPSFDDFANAIGL